MLAKSIAWTRDLDAAIPLALEAARARLHTAKPTRDDLLKHARKWLVTKFQNLRHSLTEDALSARVTTLNSGRTKNDPDFIWVIPPIWKCKASFPEKEEARTAKTTAVAEANTPSMQLVLAQPTSSSPSTVPVVTQSAEDPKVADSIVERLVRQQGDLEALLTLQLNELTDSRAQMTTLNGQMALMTDVLTQLADSVKIFAELSVKKKKAQQPFVPRPVEVVQEGKRIKTPNKTDEVTDAVRGDFCFGPAWEDIIDCPLTENEKKWQELQRYKARRHLGTTRQGSPGMIVFGWFATVYDLQQIFYRLNPERIRWIHTYKTDLRVSSAINKIEPRYGQVALICQNYREDSVNPNEQAIEICKTYGIPWIKLRGHNVGTDTVAYKLLNTVFVRDWNEYSRQVIHEEIPRNGHAILP
jgi:hypothetical protein